MPDSNFYTSLITSSHGDKPKFVAFVEAICEPFADIQANLEKMTRDFDLDVEVGAQLDILGLWAGISRTLPLPITGVFFALDTDGVGFDEGVWLGPYETGEQLTRLDDETYRLVIKAKIGANHWDGTIATWQQVMELVLQGTGTDITMIDRQDMSMDIVISGAAPSVLIQKLITQGYIQLKPAGVRINGYFITSVSGAPVFAFDVDTAAYGGWDTGAWAISL